MLLSLWSGVHPTAKAAGNYTKTNALSVGDIVVMVCETAGTELSGISTTSTKYGLGTAFSGDPGGLMLLEVCAGSESGTFAFKNNGKYLFWSSGNSLNVNGTLNANSSWKITFDSSGNATMANAADNSREIRWNKSSPRFACYTGSTLTNASYYKIQFYKAGANACFHENIVSAETVPATCEEAGVRTYTCANPNCNFSWTEAIAALGHQYGFEIVNEEVYRICATCSHAEAVTLNTIAEAKAYEKKTVTYNIKGVVTYIKDRTVYIEDENDGLCVFFPNTMDLSLLSLGDEIFVSSTMTEYKGLPELDNPKSFLILSSGNPLPETTNVTIAQLKADTDHVYLGKRVTLKGVSIGVINPSGYTLVEDSNGDSISIYALPQTPAGVEAGNLVNVTAVVSFYNTDFQLLVNPSTALKDLVKVGDGTTTKIETVPIATARAGGEKEYYQVEGIVTAIQERRVVIQDDSAGIVVYLASVPTEAPCKIGDKLRVYGYLAEYRGFMQLQYVDYTDPTFFSVVSSGNAVAAQPITIEELLRDSAIDHEYYGEKVFLNDVSILEIADNGTVTLWDNDYTIEIYLAPALNADCVVSSVVDVTGTVAGYDFNYELLINDPNVVTFGSSCAHKETVYVNYIAPTCTEEGYAGDMHCTLCGEFMGYGAILPKHYLTTVTINDLPAECEAQGYTGDKYCDLCEEDLGAGDVIEALGHDMVAVSTIPATCTENGTTSYVCSRCEISYEEDDIAPLGHDCTYEAMDKVHSYLCINCGESGEEEHSYEDGVCVLCGALAPEIIPNIDKNIIIRHTLNLASDISVSFVIPTYLLEGYTSVYLECTMNIYNGNQIVGEECIVIDNPIPNGTYDYFTLTGVNATQMNNEIRAVLYMSKGEELYMSELDVYSVATYAYAQLDKDTASDSLKTLCADLLRYGAAAQIYKSYRTDNLADAKMTEKHKTYLSDLDTLTFGNNNRQLGNVVNAPITWVGKTLILDSKVTVRFIFDASEYTGDVNELSMTVNFRNYQGFERGMVVEDPKVYNADKNWYYFEVDSLLAAELRTVLNISIWDMESQVCETMEYSPDTYGNGKTGNLLNVCKAMIAYSDSALYYFNNK
ncbi:MAG: hypothetical protein IKT58_04510 [Oscillospiraceae bacterium]|nr:hypothetical protein [Oscillospiraceae bacterium]